MKTSLCTAFETRMLSRMTLLSLLASECSLLAADTNSPPVTIPPMTAEEMFEGGTNTYSNWVDVSVGGFSAHGNRSQASRQHQNSGNAFGGISDLHFQQAIDKITTFSIDGRGLFNEHDYKLSLGVEREKVGYVRVSLSEYRTWSSGDGGFYPPGNEWYPFSPNALSLDRGSFSFEAGTTSEKYPKLTLKYTHGYRQGEKGSTIWGITHPAVDVVQGLSPSIYDIHERTDAIQLDISHHIKSTQLGGGIHYEFGNSDNALRITQSPGEPTQQRITDRQGNRYDLFNFHFFSESPLQKKLTLTSGFSYTDLHSTFTGRRIYGSEFDAVYAPNAAAGFGYYDLSGTARLHEYVMDLNLLYRATPTLTVTPSLRAQQEIIETEAISVETLGANAPVDLTGKADSNPLNIRERLDVTYTGVTNWVFLLRGDWTEGSGDLRESGGLSTIGGIGIPSVNRKTDGSTFFQKYSASARWYPSRVAVVGLGGYLKIHQYDYDQLSDSTSNSGASGNRYPAYLALQRLKTYDGNAQLTLRVLKNVTTVSRYEYQTSSIHTRPDAASQLDEVESATLNSHILSQDISWTPWPRLGLQTSFNYVLSSLQTPVSHYTDAILESRNNYWMVSFTPTWVVDDKSDLSVRYSYYQASDYQNNAVAGVPYGTGAREHGVTAILTRRITKNLQLLTKYGYYDASDSAFGAHADYHAHLIYSTLRYRF